MSRSEGRWVWSACRWETRTRSAHAACRGGTEPRTRRRWPSRAVRTGSNRTVVSPSRHVLVLCPHHVSVPVTAQLARFSSRSGSGIGLDHHHRCRGIAVVAPGSPEAECRIWSGNLQVRASART
jgi:hypothetical protein